jgi:hypothetical protein
MCCYDSLFDLEINWEAITACGTVALAIITISLAFAAIKQLKDIRTNSAENIIMKQIEFHYKIVEGIKSKEMGQGEDAFKFMYTLLAKSYFSNYDIIRNDDESIKSNIGIAYSDLHRRHGNLLGHYYRNLYRTFKNINDTKIKGFNKNRYAKLVRAQLSEYEILLLFYNCLWVGDDDKFKKLVQDYGLLEGINYDKLLDRRHDNLYLETAFGNDFI